MKRIILLLPILLIAIASCNRNVNKAIAEMKEMMTQADYSYVVQPIFKETKESAESMTKNMFNADEVRIGASGFHKYDPETKTQKDQIYRLQAVLLNSKSVTDFNNEAKMNDLGRDVAKYVVSQIANNDKYTKIQITFAMKEEKSQIVRRQNIFYTLPEFRLTEMLGD